MDLSVKPLAIVTSQINTLARHAIALLPNLVAAIVFLLITWLIAYLIGRSLRSLLRRSKMRASLAEAMEKLSRIMVWTFGLLLAATVVFPGLTPTKLLAGLGIGSIAVGLAFKDIFENFLAGFLILLRKPMRIGDDIECEGLSGRVEAISIRDTFLRKRSGELVLMPNSYLFKNPVKILTDQPTRRIEIVVGVAYGEDVDAARDVIRGAVETIEKRDKNRGIDVFAREFNSSSIDFLVRWWTDSTPRDEHESRDLAVAAIKRALDEAGIEIPFPYRTLTFKDPLKIQSDEKE
ncbi:mechanosensitive ion channel family protein [Martelella limonii]|uniref:mechanosensitive ion channel family protein n=1 Tax=Martelella limonii TaxID=1647649 RepID=UPI001581290E|nr:mechanosensitive ion channel family protein [Martelella limonii]